MSNSELTTVTLVYPLPGGGEPVRYPNCEIDEMDGRGNLRITAVGQDDDAAGVQYVAWSAGTFSRAETRLEAVAGGEGSP